MRTICEGSYIEGEAAFKPGDELELEADRIDFDTVYLHIPKSRGNDYLGTVELSVKDARQLAKKLKRAAAKATAKD